LFTVEEFKKVINNESREFTLEEFENNMKEIRSSYSSMVEKYRELYLENGDDISVPQNSFTKVNIEEGEVNGSTAAFFASIAMEKINTFYDMFSDLLSDDENEVDGSRYTPLIVDNALKIYHNIERVVKAIDDKLWDVCAKELYKDVPMLECVFTDGGRLVHKDTEEDIHSSWNDTTNPERVFYFYQVYVYAIIQLVDFYITK
jgi:hypothetical protein